MKKRLFPHILVIRITGRQKRFVDAQSKEVGKNTYVRSLIQKAMNGEKHANC